MRIGYGELVSNQMFIGNPDPPLLFSADSKFVWSSYSSEMRSHVITPAYHLRRLLDSMLSALFPPSKALPFSNSTDPSTLLPFPTEHVKGWSSLYTMVTFRPDVPYKEALRKERWQKAVVSGVVRGVEVGLGAAVAFGSWRVGQMALREYRRRA